MIPGVVELLPAATHTDPVHAIPCAPLLSVLDRVLQLVPFVEVKIAVPSPDLPAATHKDPFHDTPAPVNENILEPCPVQLIPSGDVAIVFVPVPVVPIPAPYVLVWSPKHPRTS
jgi:hypothetical protein